MVKAVVFCGLVWLRFVLVSAGVVFASVAGFGVMVSPLRYLFDCIVRGGFCQLVFRAGNANLSCFMLGNQT